MKPKKDRGCKFLSGTLMGGERSGSFTRRIMREEKDGEGQRLLDSSHLGEEPGKLTDHGGGSEGV